MNQSSGEIRCMLIPLREGRLLLPNASVAEVIGYRDPDPVPADLNWLKGMVSWQQREIPVIDFEHLMGRSDAAAGIRQRIVVCYALNPEAGWPLLGLVAQGIPRLLRVSRETIDTAQGDPADQSAVRMTLSVSGETLLVPDLDFLQAQLPTLGARA